MKSLDNLVFLAVLAAIAFVLYEILGKKTALTPVVNATSNALGTAETQDQLNSAITTEQLELESAGMSASAAKAQATTDQNAVAQENNSLSYSTGLEAAVDYLNPFNW